MQLIKLEIRIRPNLALYMRISGKQLVLVALLVLLPITSTAQQLAPLTRKELALKAKLDKLSAQAPISVVRRQADEEFGTFVSNDQEGFTFYDVDKKIDVTLRYEDVEKIKNGYGEYNSLTRRHTDHTKAIVITVVVVAGLAALIGAVAASK